MLESFPEVQKISGRYLVAVTVATEVPPDAPDAEFYAVIDVIRNRAKTYGSELKAVMAPRQFSAVCHSDYWIRALAGEWQPAHVAKCFSLLDIKRPDSTQGATHYYSPISMLPLGSVPYWAATMTALHVPGVRDQYFRFFK